MLLDRYDWQILDVLQANGRISNQELADRIGLSPSPCLRRVRALEEAGLIIGYRALLDPRALGLSLARFCLCHRKHRLSEIAVAAETRRRALDSG